MTADLGQAPALFFVFDLLNKSDQTNRKAFLFTGPELEARISIGNYREN